jgi:hypothetical protein
LFEEFFNYVVRDLSVCFLFTAFFSDILVEGVVFGCSHFSFLLLAVLKLFSHMDCKLSLVFCLVVVPAMF